VSQRQKPESPYLRLQRLAREWAYKVRYPRTVTMYAPFSGIITVDDIIQRVAAAQQLGWDVRARSVDGKLLLEYVERPGRPPSEIEP
jgi:hypothetical protein